MAFVNPQFLVETDWLAAHLEDTDLRVFDCTVFFVGDGRDRRTVSGRAAWERGHIPGSGYADLLGDLSDPGSRLPMMRPSPERFAAAMGRYGVGDGSRVVLYDASADLRAHMWAARVWWLLRTFGFDNAAVLSGGWYKWTREGRPVSTEPPAYPPATFTPRPRPELVADRADVLAAIDDGAVCLVNALSEEDHAGRTDRYGRPGHIPSSVNVPTAGLVDPETHAYLPAEQLRARFAAAGVLDRPRIITYCGGGIAASSDTLVLALLGRTDAALYDASLSEWAKDESLPLVTS